MANDGAWQAGIDIAGESKYGSKRSKTRNKNASDAKQSGGGGGGGGGNPWSILSLIPKMHSGGRVKKTGPYLLKKGEHVITAKQAKTHHRKNLGTKATKKRVTKR